MSTIKTLASVIAVIGLVMAVALVGLRDQRAAGQAAGVGGVQVISVVADDAADPAYQTPYTYLIDAGDLVGVTPATTGSETYQLYDDGNGAVLNTSAVGADGSVVLTYAAQDKVGDLHVININDPGDGSGAVGVDNVVTVVVNPGAGSTPAEPTQPAVTPTDEPADAASTGPEPSGANAVAGNRAAIYSGDCGQDFSDDPVADLDEVAVPGGDERGADTGEPVRTSFSTLDDVSLGDLLNDNHVVTVFDTDDDTIPLACGAIGGIVAGDGSLAIALQPVEDSGVSGIAYFGQDGDQTQASVFLSVDAGSEATPAV